MSGLKNIKGFGRTQKSTFGSVRMAQFNSTAKYRASKAAGFDLKRMRSTQITSQSSPRQSLRGLMGYLGGMK